MTLVSKVFPWVFGTVVIALAALATDYYLAGARAAAFCDDLAPGTEMTRVNEVISRLSERSGVVKVFDHRPGYVSVVFGGPFINTARCVVRLDLGKTTTVQVTRDNSAYRIEGSVKTIGHR
jgi:hypothetical protein